MTKRGRPTVYQAHFGEQAANVEKELKYMFNIHGNVSNRTITNLYYISAGEQVIMEAASKIPNVEYLDKNGDSRRGIYEQIGRMKASNFSDDDIIFVANCATQLFKDGYTSKEVERWIRKTRIEASKKGEVNQ